MQSLDIKTISAMSGELPQCFEHLIKPVINLYVRGNEKLLREDRPRLGIVGTRAISEYGLEITRDMARAAAQAGITVVSGLAFGVDQVAHQSTLDVNGHTVAVLPSSLSKIYPASHHHLAMDILEKDGLLISEYSEQIAPIKHVFIARNRIIAALSDVLLITEAGDQSGTQHTVSSMIALGKTIAAIPGPITSRTSIGANRLIRDGAIPILSTAELLSLFGINEKSIKSEYRGENECETAILNVLRTQKASTNQLCDLTNLPVSAINANLTMLEVRGAIESINGKWKLI